MEAVESFTFSPEMLSKERPRGVSGFLRVRNGEDFVRESLTSHIDYLDEIVCVYNRCTDQTPDILLEMERRYPQKIRLFHYVPDVAAPGSEWHKELSWDSVHCMSNYSNFALTQTRFSHAVKVDDDQLLFGERFSLYCDAIRAGRDAHLLNSYLNFSGVNLFRSGNKILIPSHEPISGHGDIGIFPVGSSTYFTKNRKFERLNFGSLRRQAIGFMYWHLKFLKRGEGFNNYDLQENQSSRYHKRLRSLRSTSPLSLADFCNYLQKNSWSPFARFSAKKRMQIARNMMGVDLFQGLTLKGAVERFTPGDLSMLKEIGEIE